MTATNTGDANVLTVTFSAPSSIGGHFSPSVETTFFSIAGGETQGYCGIGVDISLAGDIAVGKTYTLVDRGSYDDKTYFLADDHAFLTFRAGSCDAPPIQKGFESVADDGAAVTTDSIVGTVVTVSVEDVVVIGWQDAEYSGAGTMVVNGGARADCFYTDR